MQLPYKDIRGEWWILVRFTPTEIRITHKKREQSWNTPRKRCLTDTRGKAKEWERETYGSLISLAGQEFKFTWELQMKFARDVSDLTSCNVFITEVEFSDSATPEFRTKVMSIMREFYRPNSHS